MTLLLDEKIERISQCLTAADIPHAFGGALALAYYAVPRGTQDIDFNVFVRARQAAGVLKTLLSLGVDVPTPREQKRLTEHGQVRVFWDRTPLDVFFSYDPLHQSCQARAREVPFGEKTKLHILSAEDLVVFKVLFDRTKDWTDLDELLYAQGANFDAAYTLQWLRRILEPKDTRLARFIERLEAD